MRNTWSASSEPSRKQRDGQAGLIGYAGLAAACFGLALPAREALHRSLCGSDCLKWS